MFRNLLLGAFWPNRHIFALTAGYLLVAEALSQIYNFHHTLDLYHRPLIPAALIITPIALCLLLAMHRPTRPVAFLRSRASGIANRVTIGAPVVILLSLFLSSFSSLKSAIPILNPNSTDVILANIDADLHGRHPWELLQPLLGEPWITVTIDAVYTAWMPIMTLVVVTVAFWIERPLLRNQYLVAFVLVWTLLGLLVAAACFSVGPIYYSRYLPEENDLYGSLLSYLQDVNELHTLRVIAFSEFLWRVERAGLPGIGTGISAMPSIHVAVAVLQILLAWRISRVLGIVALLYAFVIMIGSVHLGWHYAIDGYVSAIAVPVIWVASGWIVRHRGLFALTARPPVTASPANGAPIPSAGLAGPRREVAWTRADAAEAD